MGSLAKISKTDYNKIASNNEIVLENNVKVNNFIRNLECQCIKFDMTYFVKNFPILAAKEGVNYQSERFDDGKTINLFED